MGTAVVDDIINRLLEAKGKPGKQVQLSDAQIRLLCLHSKDIFLKQPNLLELEAPIKICGIFTSTPSSPTRRRNHQLHTTSPSLHFCLFLFCWVFFCLSSTVKWPWNAREQGREKQRSTGGEREKMERKEEGGPSNGNKLGPTKISLDLNLAWIKKQVKGLISNLSWDSHKI